MLTRHELLRSIANFHVAFIASVFVRTSEACVAGKHGLPVDLPAHTVLGPMSFDSLEALPALRSGLYR